MYVWQAFSRTFKYTYVKYNTTIHYRSIEYALQLTAHSVLRIDFEINCK